MRVRAVIAIAWLGLIPVTVTACSSGSKSSASTTTKPAAAASSSSPSPSSTPSTATSSAPANSGPTAIASSAGGAVTFDGDYTGTITVIQCVGSGPTTTVQVNANFTSPTSQLPGSFGSTELGFEGPNNTQFDSGFLNKALDSDGKGFNVEGIKVKDPDSGKTLTLHGTLHCS